MAGFEYKNRTLLYKNKIKHRFEIEIGDAAYEVFAMCQEFFKITLGVTSEMDAEKDRKHLEEAGVRKIQSVKWSEVKRNAHTRNMLISNYVKRLTEEHSLNEIQECSLKTLLRTGFLLKQFDEKKDIELEIDRSVLRISSITGLEYSAEEKQFVINEVTHPLKPPKKNSGRSACDKKKKICNLAWTKFLEDVRKSREKISFSAMIKNSPAVISSMTHYSASVDAEKYEANIAVEDYDSDYIPEPDCDGGDGGDFDGGGDYDD
jgi:hypothetical protein